MSTFEVKVVKVDNVERHPNADRLTLVTIGGYVAISNLTDSGEWRYQPGDLVVYIPADAVLPEWLLKEMGFWDDKKGKGMLNGSLGNRVKAMKLRGTFSEGILFPVVPYHDNTTLEDFFVIYNGNDFIKVQENEDVAEFLQITKYEPVIPQSMSGEVFSASKFELMERHGLSDIAQGGYTPVKYDIDAWEKHQNLFEDGELVQITEKLHGTFCGFSVFPDLISDDLFATFQMENEIAIPVNNAMIYSKGLGGKGLCFLNNEQNANNLYVSAFKALSPITKNYLNYLANANDGIHVVGEIFGKGVQDLDYGTAPSFRIFDIYVGRYNRGRFLSVKELGITIDSLGLTQVPVLATNVPWWTATCCSRLG